MVTAQNILAIAKKYIGTTESNGGHKKIIDAYNDHKPLAVGYKVKYTDDWCDVFVSKVFIEAGATGLSGTECGVDRHIQLFKSKGIWDENGNKTPQVGDIITYNWDDNTQSNDGFADHIGFVEKVSDGVIQTIEGNYGNSVMRRAIRVGHGNIRGFARPKYSALTTTTPTNTIKSIDTLVAETKAGKHGNGDARKKSLGSNYDAVMKVINGGSKPVAKPVTNKKRVYLPKSAKTWRVYKTSGPYTTGKEIGFLAPAQYCGLDYEIIKTLATDVYQIKTSAFGNVAIYAAKSTGATIK